MKVLVISPHADDETLGAGGTLLKYKEQGAEINWLNITDLKEEYGYSRERVLERTIEIKNTAKAYQVEHFFNLRLKPAGVDEYGISFLVSEISKVICEVQPDTIFIPYKYDVHSDHKVVFEATFSCTKVFRHPYVKKILCMEILSETDYAEADSGFIPNYFVDISDYLEQKITIMKNYGSEMGSPPFPRSAENIRSLARYRGAAAGVMYAEGFRLLKMIE